MKSAIAVGLSMLMTIGFLAVVAPTEQTSAYGWGSRPTSGAYHPDAPPAIFLDVDGNSSIDVNYTGFKPIYPTSGNDGWQAVNDWSGSPGQRYPSWNALVYPGPVADNAQITLDSAVDGWYYIYVSMEMPPANMTGYYNLQLWINLDLGIAWDYSYQMVMTFIGNGILETAYPYYHQSDDYASVHTTINPTGNLGPNWYGTLNESPLTGLPWQHSDFAGDWGIWIDYNQDETSTKLRIKTVWAALIPTSGPPTVVGNQILRPDGDIETPDSWFVYPTGAYYAAIDETTLYSDNDTSYLSATLSGFSLAFSMTDPSESLGVDGSFRLTLWIISKSSEFYAADRSIYVGLTSDYYAITEQEATTYTGYHNLSFSFPTNPGTGRPWTWTELVDLKLFIRGEGNLTISQSAVIITDIDYVPSEDQPSSSFKILHWIRDGGILTLFGVLGFFGMIVTPTITYLQYKAGEEPVLASANGVWFMVLSFGLFVTGVWAAL